MALVEMMNKGYLKHIVSQNIDGLHRKSGIPADGISELHGNTNCEQCAKCGTQYMRDYRVRTSNKVYDHKTGRKCDNKSCNGDLKDTILNFGEYYDEDLLDGADTQGAMADVMLVIGSSMRVQTAAEVATQTAENGGKLIIINLQKGPYDKKAALMIHAKIDDVFKMLMEKLQLQIPKWE